MTRHRAPARPGRRPVIALVVVAAVVVVAAAVGLVAPDGAGTGAPGGAPATVADRSAPSGPAPSGPAAGPDLEAAVAAAEEAGDDAGPSGLDLAVAVHDRATGATATGAAGDEVFNAASLAKLLVAVDVLDQRRRGAAAVGEGTLERVRAALGPSSDPAMNALWSGLDGDAGITRTAARLGLPGTTAPDDPSQWGEVGTSARDVVRVLAHVRAELPAADRDLMLGALTDPPARAADGFDQGYGLLDGTPEPVKQGWLCCLGNSVDLHTAGIVADRFAVAVLTNQPRGWDRARATVDAATRALRGALADTPTG